MLGYSGRLISRLEHYLIQSEIFSLIFSFTIGFSHMLQSNQDQIRFWLALNRLYYLSQDDVKMILASQDNFGELFDKKFSRCFSREIQQQIQMMDWAEIENEMRWLEKPNHSVITIVDDHYPFLLREISSPPLVLYVAGDPSCLQQMLFAMVGSRNPTPMGYEMARDFATTLAEKGLVIVSGLAMGIDAASHEGALLSGKTVAVLGTGLNEIYPKRNQDLADRVVEQGALVSEFPLLTKPLRKNFPRRNRIISGLSVGTLVVEASLHSGSLITANFALEQNREVFAIPGSIHSPLSKGCHRLLRNGAKLVETGEDVIVELVQLAKLNNDLGDLGGFHSGSAKKNKKEKLAFSELGVEYKELLRCIGFETTAIDTIITLSGLTSELVSSMLITLELKGFLTSVPGGYARLK